MDALKVVVLAGGNSTRFAPLGDKNLFKFLGKSLVEQQLSQLKQHGFANITVIANPNSYKDIEAEARLVDETIRVIAQDGEGQAGAVQTALFGSPSIGDLLVINMNDIFTPELINNFTAKLPGLRESGRNLLTGYKVTSYFPGGYLVRNSQGFITSVMEKPGAGNEPSDYVRLVWDYFHDVNQLKSAMAEAGSQKDDVYEVALTNMMTRGQEFVMLEYTSSWHTLKYPWHVLSTMEYFLSSIPEPKIDPSAEIAESAVIKGNVIIEAGVRVFEHATIKGPAYIGKNSIIANNALVRASIIGEGCVIGFASEVARSYLRNKIWLHMNYVGDSIVDNNVSFGSTALTANLRLDEGTVAVNIKAEKIDSNLAKLGAIIGADVRIGVGVKLMPGVKIGRNSALKSGLLINIDIPENTYADTLQTLELKPNRINIAEKSREHSAIK